MKRLTSLVILFAMILGTLPAARAAEPCQSWKLEMEWNAEADKYLYGYKSGNTWVIEPQYDYVDEFGKNGLAVVAKDGKYGIIDTAGAWVLEPAYDGISGAGPDGLCYFKQNGKYGVMDASGRVVHPADIEADWLGQFVNGSCVYVEGEKYGLVGVDGRRITEPVYDEIKSWFEPADGARPARKGELWGILAADGTERAPIQYDDLELWTNGYARVGLNGKVGILRPDGTPLTGLVYEGASWGDEADLYDSYDALPDPGLATVTQNGRYGAVGLATGELSYPCAYASRSALVTAICLKETDPDKLWETADRLGREAGLQVTWYPGEDLTRLYGSDRMLRVKGGKCALSGLDGTLYTDYVFDTVQAPGLDGLFPAAQNGKWGKLDRNGNTVVEFLYDTKDSIGVNARFVGKWGDDSPPYALFTLDGKQVTDYIYWTHSEFVNGYAMVSDGDEPWGYIDAAGTPISERKYWSIGDETPYHRWYSTPFGEDGLAAVRYIGSPYGYNIIDTQGHELLEKPSNKRPWRAGFGLWGYVDSETYRMGFVDSTGKIVIEPKYFFMEPSIKGGSGWNYDFDENGLLTVDLDSGTEGGGLLTQTIDTTGKVVGEGASEQYSDPDLYEGLRWTSASARGINGSEGGGWGFEDEAGKLVVPHLYDAVGYFDQGYASVRAGNVGTEWGDIWAENVTVTVSGAVYGMLKNPLQDRGEQTLPAEETAALAGLDILWLDGAEGELAPLGSDQLVTDFVVRGYGRWQSPYGDYGLWSVEGEHLLTADQAGAAGCYPQGPSDARIYKMSEEKIDTGEPGGDTRYTDILGRTYLESELWDWDAPWNPPELDSSRAVNPETNRIEDGKYFYADPWTGEIVLPAIYDQAASFSDGIGLVTIDGDRFAIDRTGARLFDLNQYEDFTWFEEGRLRVKDRETGKQGFLDKTGEPVGPGLVWDEVRGFHKGSAEVRKNGRWGVVDLEGGELIPCIFDDISGFTDGIATVTLNGRQGILRDPRYEDKVSGWAQTEVAAATSAGYVTESCREYQTFTTTRRQFAELVVNYLEKATGEAIAPAPADTFTDTADEAVRKAYAAGVVQGVGEGRFSPGGLLTREQLATMLWRAMEKAGAGMWIGGTDEYSDWEQVSGWAQYAMNNLINYGVMKGTSATTLSPKESCTVEQAVLLVLRASEVDFTTRAEQEAQLQAAKDRVRIQGLAIGTPLDQLPDDLRAALTPVGQPYDGWETEPGKEIAQHYEAPGITVITSRATEEVLRRMVENNDDGYLTEVFGTTDREAILERELGREYVEKVILTSDGYSLASGLKVGDSEERARKLGHGEGFTGETVGFYGSTQITWEKGVATQIQVWDGIGRRVGPFFDP